MASISDPLAGCWYAVATSDAVENDPYPIEVRDVAYVLWRGPDGALIATIDRCTHREAKLSPRHRHRRLPPMPLPRLDVRRRRTMRQRSVIGPACNHRTPAAHLSPLAVTEQYGLIWFCPAEPTQPIPYLGVDDNRSFTRLNTSMQVWNCSVPRG
jgi:phenylpropionate dioxygenase-like ring-hydroxylating dioxygenase large terminal subunit